MWKNPLLSFAALTVIGLVAGRWLDGNAPQLFPFVAWGCLAFATAWSVQIAGFEPAFIRKLRGKVTQSHHAAVEEAKAAPPPLEFDPQKVCEHIASKIRGQDHVIERVFDSLTNTKAIKSRCSPVISICLAGLSRHGTTTFTSALAEAVYGPGRVLHVKPGTFKADFFEAMEELAVDPRFVIHFEDFDRAVVDDDRTGASDIVKALIEKNEYLHNGKRISLVDASIIVTVSERVEGQAISKLSQEKAKEHALRSHEIKGKLVDVLKGSRFDIVDGFATLKNNELVDLFIEGVQKTLEEQGLGLAPGALEKDLVNLVYSELHTANTLTPKDATLWAEKRIPKAAAEYHSIHQNAPKGALVRVSGSLDVETGEIRILVTDPGEQGFTPASSGAASEDGTPLPPHQLPENGFATMNPYQEKKATIEAHSDPFAP